MRRVELGGFRRHTRTLAVLLAVGCLQWGCGQTETLLERASGGDGQAQLELGDQFAAEGDGRNLATARKWYEKAAKQGIEQAQLHLLGVGREKREVGAFAIPAGTQGIGFTR